MKNKPQGIIRLTGQSIKHQTTACTGAQLVDILEVLQSKLSDCRWLIADISTNDGKLPNLTNGDSPYYLENIQALIDFSRQIDQYWSGIFLAIPKIINKPVWKRIFDTEDVPTHDLEHAVLEIRAFDTSYFEIYSSNINVLQILSEHFKEPIQHTVESAL